MMKKVSTTTPKITAEHITGYGPDTGARIQSIRLPDLYQKVRNELVRYRVKVDTSYLFQSEAVAEVWLTGGGWTELVSLHLDREFYVVRGPDNKASDPDSRELTSTSSISTKGAEYVAQSWQKIYDHLFDHAAMILDA